MRLPRSPQPPNPVNEGRKPRKLACNLWDTVEHTKRVLQTPK